MSIEDDKKLVEDMTPEQRTWFYESAQQFIDNARAQIRVQDMKCNEVRDLMKWMKKEYGDELGVRSEGLGDTAGPAEEEPEDSDPLRRW